MELGVNLDDRPADRQHPGGELDVAHAQLGQLPPAQAALDGGLHQQLGLCVGQAVIQDRELLRREDGARLGRDRRCLHAPARVE